MSNIFIEQRIINAVRGLLTGRVNEILRELDFPIPIIEFGNYGCGCAISPKISLTYCECTEKERIIRLDAYSLTIAFSVREMPESELYCYTYANAMCKAVGEDTTLGRIADRAVVKGKKYNPPENPCCGENWEVILTMRVTVEGMRS